MALGWPGTGAACGAAPGVASKAVCALYTVILMSTVLGSFATPAAAQAVRASPPRVVATVAPVHSLVAQIMEGIGRPLLLLPSGASPHGTALRLSQMRALRRADIVFWIGAGFETFLAAPLEAMAGDSRIVTLIEQPGMAPGPARRRAGSDPHIWLDPENGIRILRAAEAALTAADPANASRYGANLSRAAARLASLDRELADVLKRVEGIPYVVFHDAYGYFERRYRLSPVAHITVAPHRPPGAARLRRIRRTIASGRAGCVFTEPQFPPKLAAMLVAGAWLLPAYYGAAPGCPPARRITPP